MEPCPIKVVGPGFAPTTTVRLKSTRRATNVRTFVRVVVAVRIEVAFLVRRDARRTGFALETAIRTRVRRGSGNN